jgi:hypothetical protein
MSIRKRNDSVKSGHGIDGSLGERYSKTGAVDPWNSNPRGNFISKKGVGAYQDADASFLRNLPANDGTRDMSDATDIWEAVENQSSDSGNRAVRSGRKD